MEHAKNLKSAYPESEILTFKVPTKIDQDLSVDSLYLPMDKEAETLLVFLTGVHGPEAYGGSAFLEVLFQEYLNSFYKKKLALLLIHAFNPYGFKYHRRVNEDNINLNRNFLLEKSEFTRVNLGHKKLVQTLAPSQPVGHPGWSFIKNSFFMLQKLIFTSATLDDLTEAVANGQHQYPKGLEYGGVELAPQVVYLRNLLADILPGHKNVVFLDIHTGLGKSGTLHLIGGEQPPQESQEWGEELFREGENKQHWELTTQDSVGFYHTYGDSLDLAYGLKGPGQKMVAFTFEVGTIGNGILPKLRSLNRLILENQGHHYGHLKKSYEAEVQSDFLNLFFPSEANWQERFIRATRKLLTTLLGKL